MIESKLRLGLDLSNLGHDSYSGSGCLYFTGTVRDRNSLDSMDTSLREGAMGGEGRKER